ncbi:MAG: tail fiber domain-containing protein, partial [Bacteroidetes bacterium]|nr:tail fiber domain-containing protein [Bacteroidota bacterium]
MKNIFLFIALFGGASLLAQNVGVDQTNPASKLDVNGNLSVGSSYSGTFTAPVNGAIFEGKVGIGTSNPTGNLDVRGEDAQLSISIPNGNNWTFTHYFDNENLYIQRRLGSGGFGGNLVVIDTIGKMGLKLGGSYSPQSDLHIKQSGWQTAGIRLEEASTTNNWVTYIHHSSGDYAFNYNGSFLAWINKIDGTFSHISDVRLKKDIHPMGSVLSKVLALNPTTYQFKTQSEEDKTVSIG